MNSINGKMTSASQAQAFFNSHPDFDTHNDPLLDHRSARRWFDILRNCVQDDVYTFQEILESKTGPEVTVGGSPYCMMSSYDYLGLVGHPGIEAAAIEAIRQYGTGSGGVRLLTGTNELHRVLENRIACFKETESAMVFSSGYLANLAAIHSLFVKEDVVITDEFIHRSITDAIKLAGLRHECFRHNDMDSLRSVLSKYAAPTRKLIIAEGVYSMDGDICPLPEIVALKEEYGALLMIDEAHSLGVLGRSGRGVHDHFHIAADKVDIYTGSLSKAVPASGGFIAAKEEVIVYLKHSSAPFIFSAALTPPNTAAAIAALQVMEREHGLQPALMDKARYLAAALRSAGIDTGHTQSPVIPVMLATSQQALSLSRQLFRLGFIANAVIYPAVAANRARLRLCCTAAHTVALLDRFVETLIKCMCTPGTL